MLPPISLSEISIQAECFQWAWNTHPQTRRLLFHVPNGGSRGKIEAMQLKASGVIAGIPDLIMAWKGKIYGFELKTQTGRLSPVQQEVHNAWLANGNPVVVIRSVEEFKLVFSSIIQL